MPVSHKRCAYKGCSNTKAKNLSLNFHRFPKCELRRSQWILRSGNLALLHLSEKAFENKRLCSKHFSDNDIKHINKGVRYLKDSALPLDHLLLSKDSNNITHEGINNECVNVTSNIDCNDSVSPANLLIDLQLPILIKKEHSKLIHVDEVLGSAFQNIRKDKVITSSSNANQSSVLSNNVTDDNSIGKYIELATNLQAQLDTTNKRVNLIKNIVTSNHQKEINKLKNKILKYQKSLRSKSKKIQNLESKITKNEEVATFNNNFKNLNQSVLDSIQMQVNHDIKLKMWTNEEKEIAISLFRKSPQVYCYLRDEKEFALPCDSLIQKWINAPDLKSKKSDNFSLVSVCIR